MQVSLLFLFLASPAFADIQQSLLNLKNGQQMSQTELRKLAEEYDDAQLWTKKERADIRFCQNQIHGRGYMPDSRSCHVEGMGAHLRKKTLSDSWEFMNTAGWPLQGFAEFYPVDRNQFAPLAGKTPRQVFVDAFVSFWSNPEFQCQQPGVYRFLKSRFQTEPFLPSCKKKREYFDISSPTGLSTIDTSRIYRIDFLFAGEGRAIFSRWGHSMFRLVMCGPKTQMGPDCLGDDEHHLVLSFAAFLRQNEIQAWGGVSGTYPSRIFFSSFRGTLKQYNEVEMREMYSLPLKLSDEEREAFIDRAMQMHWDYEGKYYFFSNNCATESANFLRAIFAPRGLQGFRNYSPQGLFEYLKETPLADANEIKDLNASRSNGSYFESYHKRYLENFMILKKLKIKDLPMEFLYYFETSAELRGNYLDQIEKLLSPKSRRVGALAFLILEHGVNNRIDADRNETIHVNAFYPEFRKDLTADLTAKYDDYAQALRSYEQLAQQAISRQLNPEEITQKSKDFAQIKDVRKELLEAMQTQAEEYKSSKDLIKRANAIIKANPR